MLVIGAGHRYRPVSVVAGRVRRLGGVDDRESDGPRTAMTLTPAPVEIGDNGVGSLWSGGLLDL